MPGTRTAPDVTGTATRVYLSWSWIDNSGDVRSDGIYAPDDVTAAEFEAILDAIQAQSNASIFKASMANEFVGDALPGNALNAPRSPSVFDNIVLHFKNDATLASQRIFIVAPIEAAFNPSNTDVVDVADMSATVTAVEAALTGYDVKSARYTERREINTKVRL